MTIYHIDSLPKELTQFGKGEKIQGGPDRQTDQMISSDSCQEREEFLQK